MLSSLLLSIIKDNRSIESNQRIELQSTQLNQLNRIQLNRINESNQPIYRSTDQPTEAANRTTARNRHAIATTRPTVDTRSATRRTIMTDKK
jgi:hypothetical protein